MFVALVQGALRRLQWIMRSPEGLEGVRPIDAVLTGGLQVVESVTATERTSGEKWR